MEVARSELNQASGRYELSVRIADNVRRVTLSVAAKTQELAEAFVNDLPSVAVNQPA